MLEACSDTSSIIMKYGLNAIAIHAQPKVCMCSRNHNAKLR
uniref:Uncharacterized protein n=1 Tax=Arundo donax TaxID=35708 RepID=A0A0A8XXC1_ARUDO